MAIKFWGLEIVENNQHSPWGKKPSNDNHHRNKSSMRPFIITVIAVVIITFVVVWVMSSDALSGISGANLIYDFLLLAVIGAGLVAHVVSNPGQALRNIAGWIIIFGILGLGYSIWNGSSRLSSEFNPAMGDATAEAITFRADMSGHYMIRAKINGVDINFMVDTGATHVVLNKRDAEKVGYNLDRLSFDMPASTANGIVYSAAIKLNSIEVGPIRVENIDGFVNQAELEFSLLGMSFLNKLSGYEVRGGLLTLYP